MKITDQLNRTLTFSEAPKRIVSLVPSQTELLVDLGLEENIVGVTKFCVHPDYIRKQKKVVGGTKNIHINKIDDLQPDIIICNKEENTKEIVEQLEKKYPVYVSDIFIINDTISFIKDLGILFNVNDKAKTLISKITDEKKSFTNFIKNKSKKNVAYFIWKSPWMVAGNNNFINELLIINNFKNIFNNKERYPEVTLASLKTLNIDYILLSSEPYPFQEKHVKELQQYTSAKIILVDGEYFSWYGSRLVKAFSYFKQLHLTL